MDRNTAAGGAPLRLYIKDVVYGANDGIVTTFAVVAGVVGASLRSEIILVIGFASLIADGFSMAASNYLGTKSEWAVYEQDGVTSDANPALRKNPVKAATLTFIAFITAGAAPLLPYLSRLQNTEAFHYTIATTATVLFIVGGLRTLVTGKRFLASGLEMAAIGGTAAAIAYFIGYALAGLGA